LQKGRFTFSLAKFQITHLGKYADRIVKPDQIKPVDEGRFQKGASPNEDTLEKWIITRLGIGKRKARTQFFVLSFGR
jgi:hypothetical protein